MFFNKDEKRLIKHDIDNADKAMLNILRSINHTDGEWEEHHKALFNLHKQFLDYTNRLLRNEGIFTRKLS